MKIEEFAAQINNREFPFRLSQQERETAKRNEYIVVYNEEDYMVFDGYIRDKFGCCEGGIAYLAKDGLLLNTHVKKDVEFTDCRIIKVLWKGGSGYLWVYETMIPHVTFDIYKEGQKYCNAIIFDKKSL